MKFKINSEHNLGQCSKFSLLRFTFSPFHLHPLNPTPAREILSPFTFHPSPFTLHLSPFTFHPSPFSFLPSPFSFLLFTLLLLSLSCHNPAPTGVIENSSTKTEETNPFVMGNQKIVELENEDIELFLKRYEWDVKQTGTGLRYEILKTGTGKNIEAGETVTLAYRTFLLTGEEIYNSDEAGLKQFAVEKSEEIVGLHEAVQLMNKGSEARLIIPSHLAYSAAGDGYKIKPYQTIIMKIVIME